jgi:hypothetical protein
MCEPGRCQIQCLLEDHVDDEIGFNEVEPSPIYIRSQNPKLFAQIQANPPEGAIGHFLRWAAQSYRTIYNRRATYVATKRQRGKGNYWKLVNSGYGSYPYFGSKNMSQDDDSIEMPE